MSDHDHDIEALVTRARRGDHAAFASLYDAFAERLYRFVRSRVATAQDAEDLVQRVFLKVIETLPRYEQRGTPFAAFLFRLARNAVIDHLRTRHVAEALDASVEYPEASRGPEDLAIQSVELDAVARALDALTSEQQEVVALRFFAGLSHSEIGRVLGKRDGSVRALQFRAIQALREALTPKSEGDQEPNGRNAP